MKLLTLIVVLVFTLAAEAKSLEGISLPRCSFMSPCPPGLTLDEKRCQCVLPPCSYLIKKVCPPGSYLNKECECETDDCSQLKADVCTQVKCACGKYCGLGTFHPGIRPPIGLDGEEVDLRSPYCAGCGCCSTYSPRTVLRPVGLQISDERIPDKRPCSGRCPDIFAP